MSYCSSQSSSNLMLSLKVLFISTSVLSAAVALKLSVPAITDFAVSEVPSIWNGFVSWLRPPYLYLVINCIIITIVASSKLQSKLDGSSTPLETLVHVQPLVPPVQQPVMPVQSTTEYPNYGNGLVSKTEAVAEVPAVSNHEFGANIRGSEESQIDGKLRGGDLYGRVDARVSETVSTFTVNASSDSAGDEFVISKSSWTPLRRMDSSEISFSPEKPPVSARFAHRKGVKTTPEGGKAAALGVAKSKRQDTLESTWKTITEGRHMPLTRHLRKSDTWETHGGRQSLLERDPPEKMTKSETFSGRGSKDGGAADSSLSPSPGSGKLKKETSLSQDELNKRVEAFIKKFNEEMRLQRQESLNQYMEMINRGAH